MKEQQAVFHQVVDDPKKLAPKSYRQIRTNQGVATSATLPQDSSAKCSFIGASGRDVSRHYRLRSTPGSIPMGKGVLPAFYYEITVT